MIPNLPKGCGVVTPYVFAEAAGTYIDFLIAAFGAVEVGRSVDDEGGVANCQLAFGETRIMISEATEDFPAARSAFYLYVEDADAAMARAVGAGATNIMPVADRSYGDRQGGVRDPAGNIWWISQRLTGDDYY